MTTSVRSSAERTRADVARSDWFERTARVGLAARGVVYLLLGVLAFRIATDQPSQPADKAGAFQLLADRTGGELLVIVVGVGLAAYAVWRLLGAVVRRDEDMTATKRASWVGRALLYAAASATAFSVLRGRADAGGGSEQEWTATVMGWPAGQWLVAAVGVGLIGAGLWNGYRAVSRKFEEKLDLDDLRPRTRTLVRAVTIVGLIGRMAAFVAIGWFIIRAAIDFDPNEPIGLDESLRTLADGTAGPWLIAGVGIGLVCFGLASGIEAWRRRVPA